jgi:hypothetical protein
MKNTVAVRRNKRTIALLSLAFLSASQFVSAELIRKTIMIDQLPEKRLEVALKRHELHSGSKVISRQCFENLKIPNQHALYFRVFKSSSFSQKEIDDLITSALGKGVQVLLKIDRGAVKSANLCYQVELNSRSLTN